MRQVKKGGSGLVFFYGFLIFIGGIELLGSLPGPGGRQESEGFSLSQAAETGLLSQVFPLNQRSLNLAEIEEGYKENLEKEKKGQKEFENKDKLVKEKKEAGEVGFVEDKNNRQEEIKEEEAPVNMPDQKEMILRPEFKNIKEQISVYAFIGWLWIIICVLLYILGEQIKEADRRHRLGL